MNLHTGPVGLSVIDLAQRLIVERRGEQDRRSVGITTQSGTPTSWAPCSAYPIGVRWPAEVRG
jgi:hypothetical protein